MSNYVFILQLFVTSHHPDC